MLLHIQRVLTYRRAVQLVEELVASGSPASYPDVWLSPVWCCSALHMSDLHVWFDPRVECSASHLRLYYSKAVNTLDKQGYLCRALRTAMSDVHSQSAQPARVATQLLSCRWDTIIVAQFWCLRHSGVSCCCSAHCMALSNALLGFMPDLLMFWNSPSDRYLISAALVWLVCRMNKCTWRALMLHIL